MSQILPWSHSLKKKKMKHLRYFCLSVIQMKPGILYFYLLNLQEACVTGSMLANNATSGKALLSLLKKDGGF